MPFYSRAPLPVYFPHILRYDAPMSKISASRRLDQFYTDRPLARILVSALQQLLDGMIIAPACPKEQAPGPAILITPTSGPDQLVLSQLLPSQLNQAQSSSSQLGLNEPPPVPVNPIRWHWLEPSAGTGSFFDYFPPNSIGIDLDPKAKGIVKQDFLSYVPPHAGPWAVVGNPPFGKNASLALRFFNHAASFADVIAFIVPRTFEKDSLQRRLALSMHLVKEIALNPASFTMDEIRYAVPCVFQVWQKGATTRVLPARRLTHPDFSFVARPSADFAFQRVGVAAGKIKSLNHPALAAPSHHFLRVTNRKKVAEVRARFEAICWKDVKHKTAGNPSIGKQEMIDAFTAACGLDAA
jgi:hypothetical protein